jgi:hypothetical protein
VPLDSVTKAVNPTVPFVATVEAFADNVTVDPVGASNGTLSQEADSMATTMASAET